jgi:hypothetical protein
MAGITLNRTGDRSIMFEGELISKVDTRIIAGKDHNRWHELAVYRTDSGRLVAFVGYRTQWAGEIDRDDAHVCNSPEEILEFFKFVDVLAGLLGYPPGAQFHEKQARIERELSQRYDAAISEVMVPFPEEL